MIIIAGLGNPGKKFEKTRHNVGFRAVDEIAANFQLPSNAAKVKKKESSSTPIFNFQSIFNAQISKGEIADEKVILAKPQTFMNLSGKAVKLLNSKFKNRASIYGSEGQEENEVLFAFQNSKLFVVHDDIDLPLGKIRISVGRSSAGHKGVESIIRELKTKDFVRFRIGIKPINSEQRTTNNIEKFVLQKFNKEEEKILKEVIKKTIEAIEMTIKEGMEKAMSEYNK